MLMQEYLPIALRGILPDQVSSAILDLCNFFRIICYKDLTENDLNFLDSHVSLTLCNLEKIFPPSFFTVMVHLVIHLVEEVRLGGPVAFRWMYPIERDLLTLKSYVHNRAYPEGSIAEGYLAQESLTFCSRYLSGVETIFSRPIRNDDEGNQNEIEELNLLCPGRPLGKKLDSKYSSPKKNRYSNSELDSQSLAQAHRYVLFNVDSVTHFREEHKRIVKGQHRRLSAYEIDKIHSQQFSEWFKNRVARMEEQDDQRVTEELKWLARGPFESVQHYSGYLVKGYRFHTKDREKERKTQNSGVVVSVMGLSYASSRDRRPVEGVTNYYGKLIDIIELNYSSKIRVVLFRCEWVDINRGCKKDDFGATLVNFSYLTHTGDNLLDDPFVFASQVDKVFYGNDPKNKDWSVVRHIKLRDLFDMGSADAQLAENPNDTRFHVTSLHRIGEDGDDVIPDMELERISDEETEMKVTFNRYGKPIGQEGNELTQFLGSIVRRSANVDLNCCDWRKVPRNKKEDMYSLVKEKFVFAPSETTAIKKWILSSMGKKLNTWRNLIKSRNYDSSITIDQIVARQADKRVNPEQFKDLVTKWMDPKYQEICEKKRDSRSKIEEPHVTGTKSFARLAHEQAMKNNGKELTRGEIYEKSRTRENGDVVNEKAAQVVASLHAVAKDSTNTRTLEDDWRNDDFSKVKGP